MKPRLLTEIIVTLIFLAFIVFIAVWSNTNIPPNHARLERILDILEADDHLLWKVKANLDVDFEGGRAKTDENGFAVPDNTEDSSMGTSDSTPRIVALGASPTFGYGVDTSRAYPFVVKSILKPDFPGVEVINAAQIGYTTWQGLRLFRRYIDEWRPSVVTVAFMVNDIDRFRFFFESSTDDNNLKLPSKTEVFLVNLLNRFWPTSCFLRFEHRFMVKLTAGWSKRYAYKLAKTRVDAGDYERNLQEFVDICKSRNIPVILVKMRFNLSFELPPEDPDLKAVLAEAREQLENDDFTEARRLAKKVLERDSFYSLPYYIIGRALEEEGDEEGAKEYFNKAVEHLIYDCARDAALYGEIKEKVALRNNIPLVDADNALGKTVANMDFFLPGDSIHPNVAGHELIGKCLARAIKRVLSGENAGFVEKCE
ncbi:MAG: hypothetical protein FJ088_08140 [Deltaproteobacteria bacterium]|nr:hypothetical protein [Deltaproteobacteria bacterium]